MPWLPSEQVMRVMCVCERDLVVCSISELANSHFHCINGGAAWEEITGCEARR